MSEKTFVIQPKVEAVMDQIQEKLQLNNHAEVIQKALQVLAYMAITEQDVSKTFFVMKEGKLQEVYL